MKQKNTSAKVIAAIVFVLFCVAAPFLAVFLTGVLLPAQFTLTWYGDVPARCQNICGAEGDNVVFVGNSSVAFGVDSALMEELLRAGGLDYTVCNFGLYGSLGTKMMLDLAIDQVEEGDIVVLVPELAAQSLSTYFSAAEAWYAIDGDLSLFGAFGAEERGALAGSFFAYTAQKLVYCRSGAPAQPSGVYASASFDERGDLKTATARTMSCKAGTTQTTRSLSTSPSFRTPLSATSTIAPRSLPSGAHPSGFPSPP